MAIIPILFIQVVCALVQYVFQKLKVEMKTFFLFQLDIDPTRQQFSDGRKCN